MSVVINFSARLVIGGEPVPIKSQLVLGEKNSQDGTENGFIFQLDREPNDPPVTVNLGSVIAYIENKLQGGNLSANPGMTVVNQAFGIPPAEFNSSNSTLVKIYEFTINSSTSKFLFSVNVDVENSNPETNSLIPLPASLAEWMKIKKLSIAFKTQTEKS